MRAAPVGCATAIRVARPDRRLRLALELISKIGRCPFREGHATFFGMAKREELTDEQWAILEPPIPKTPPRADGRGRPITHSDRAVISARCFYFSPTSAYAPMHRAPMLRRAKHTGRAADGGQGYGGDASPFLRCFASAQTRSASSMSSNCIDLSKKLLAPSASARWR